MINLIALYSLMGATLMVIIKRRKFKEKCVVTNLASELEMELGTILTEIGSEIVLSTFNKACFPT